MTVYTSTLSIQSFQTSLRILYQLQEAWLIFPHKEHLQYYQIVVELTLPLSYHAPIYMYTC